jgi:hypothetical protein
VFHIDDIDGPCLALEMERPDMSSATKHRTSLRRDRTHWMTAAVAPIKSPDFCREAPLQRCMRLRQFCTGIVGA